MSSSNNSSVSASLNVSSERIYDLEYMMKLAASSASAMSSTSTLAQLNTQEDVSEILKADSSNGSNSPYSSGGSNYSNYDEDDYDEYEYDSDEEEYGSWYDIRTDLSDELLDELKSAVFDAISLTLPLSPETEVVSLPPLPLPLPLPVALPQRSLQTLVQQQSSYSAPIVQTPPVQFQSRAFATLASKRQTQTQTRTQTRAQRQSQVSKPSNASNAFSWRREVPRIQNSHTRGNGNGNSALPIRSSANTVSSWRKTQPGTEWKWNEETSNYTLIKV